MAQQVPKVERLETLLAAYVKYHLEHGTYPDLDQHCSGDQELIAALSAPIRQYKELRRELAADEPGLDGQTLGPYRILSLLGKGGMGEVYLAEQEKPLVRRVALKVVKLGMDSKEVLGRFESERQVLAMMDHPNIAKVFDAGITERGRPYFVMEYVQGIPITNYCDEQRLTAKERLRLLIPVCGAIHHAHQKGILHRDIKPSNVLVSLQDGQATPKVIDFGLAKALHLRLSEQTIYTQLGMIVGTPEYMSPEQAEMTPQGVDTTTDVYSLGVLLYELLTGELPLAAQRLREAGISEMQRIIREEMPPKPSARISGMGQAAGEVAGRRRVTPKGLVRQLRGDLNWITLKALEKDRRRRYQATTELAADLERHLVNQPVLASPPSTLYRAGRFCRRHAVGVTAASVIALLLAAFAGSLILQTERLEVERDRALAAESEALAISDYVTGLFEVADPGESRGATVTARELLDRGSERITTDLESEPRAQASLLATLGGVYHNLGLWRRAAELQRQALELRREELGDDHLETARSRNELGDTLRQMNQREEAKELLRRALEVRQAKLHPDDPALADSLNNLGLVLSEMGSSAEAEPFLRRSLDIRSRVLGADHKDTSTTRHNLGLLLEDEGRLEETEALQRQALASREQTLGDDHPHVGISLHALGTVLYRQGRFEEAEETLRRAVELRRRVLGEDHTDLANSLNTLASLLHDLGRLEDAEPRYREALEINLRLDASTEDVAIDLNNLASLLEDRGRYAEAESLYRRSLDIRREVFGEDSASYVRALSNLGRLKIVAGDLAGGEELVRQGLAWRRANLRPDHRDLARSLQVLAVGKRMVGHLEESRALLEEALSIFRQGMPPGHPAIALGHAELAWTLADSGDVEGCTEHVRSARDIIEEGEASVTVQGRLELGAGICHAAGGEQVEAKAAFEESLELLRPTLGSENQWVREASRRLVLLR